ncbi:MAG: hypothetical protein MHPSP_000769, partial [Paramarteilia canceri]
AINEKENDSSNKTLNYLKAALSLFQKLEKIRNDKNLGKNHFYLMGMVKYFILIDANNEIYTKMSEKLSFENISRILYTSCLYYSSCQKFFPKSTNDMQPLLLKYIKILPIVQKIYLALSYLTASFDAKKKLNYGFVIGYLKLGEDCLLSLPIKKTSSTNKLASVDPYKMFGTYNIIEKDSMLEEKLLLRARMIYDLIKSELEIARRLNQIIYFAAIPESLDLKIQPFYPFLELEDFESSPSITSLFDSIPTLLPEYTPESMVPIKIAFDSFKDQRIKNLKNKADYLLETIREEQNYTVKHNISLESFFIEEPIEENLLEKLNLLEYSRNYLQSIPENLTEIEAQIIIGIEAISSYKRIAEMNESKDEENINFKLQNFRIDQINDLKNRSDKILPKLQTILENFKSPRNFYPSREELKNSQNTYLIGEYIQNLSVCSKYCIEIESLISKIFKKFNETQIPFEIMKECSKLIFEKNEEHKTSILDSKFSEVIYAENSKELEKLMDLFNNHLEHTEKLQILKPNIQMLITKSAELEQIKLMKKKSLIENINQINKFAADFETMKNKAKILDIKVHELIENKKKKEDNQIMMNHFQTNEITDKSSLFSN